MQPLRGRTGEHHFARLGRDGALDDILLKEIPVIRALEHHPAERRIGLEHAGFGDERRYCRHMLVPAQTRQHAVRHLDGLHVVRVVIIERHDLNMRPKTRHFLRHRPLESHHHTDRHDHHRYTHDNARQSHTDSRTRGTRSALLRKIKSLSYPYFRYFRHGFCGKKSWDFLGLPRTTY